MRTATAAISIGLLLVTLTSCGDTADAPDSVKSAAPTSRPTATPTRTPTPTPSASPTRALPAKALTDTDGLTFSAPPADPMEFGVPWKWTRFNGKDAKSTGTTTVLDYQHHMAPDPANNGGLRYNQVTVRICSSTGLPITVSQQFFALVESSGRVNQTKMRSSSTKKVFPNNYPSLKPGQCAHGTVTFRGRADDTTALVVWGPNGAPRPAIWVLPDWQLPEG